MKHSREVYEPDWIDVNSQLTAIGEDFGCICRHSVTVERDNVVVVAKCYRIGGSSADDVVCQALARRPIKSKPNAAVMCFATALDCYQQLDRGALATGARDITYGWNGRPNIARRS